MSYLLFMDESGHDHRAMPFEVRGGIIVHASRVWPLVTSLRNLERRAFGCSLHEFGSELKGERLLRPKNFRFASQEPLLEDLDRRDAARRFLAKSSRSQTPTRREFTAYGQACLFMASGFFRTLARHRAKVLAAMIPRGGNRGVHTADPLSIRRDQRLLFQAYSEFLEDQEETGLLVLDETDRSDDRRYLRRMEHYFLGTTEGRRNAKRIVPAPMFIASDMSYAVQAADIVIYCINWGFRQPEIGIDGEVRREVAEIAAEPLRRLQYRTPTGSSIFCVPELYK